ncbi:MAG TPA: hypothetical protein VFM18_19425 [Methanosarcina sp.]|nr:hypothetical protein [Methanosarcina sp.]
MHLNKRPGDDTIFVKLKDEKRPMAVLDLFVFFVFVLLVVMFVWKWCNL